MTVPQRLTCVYLGSTHFRGPESTVASRMWDETSAWEPQIATDTISVFSMIEMAWITLFPGTGCSGRSNLFGVGAVNDIVG